jgi:predicted metalloprotease with PDZ domain
MRKRAFVLVGLMALVATSAFAGEKCTADAQTCLNYMAKKVDSKGWLGVHYERNEEAGGYTITKVVDGSPAEEAGLQVGDIVVAMNGVSMGEKSEALKAEYQNMKPGYDVTYKVVRNGQDVKVKAKLAKMPEDVAMQMVGAHMLSHAETKQATAEEE